MSKMSENELRQRLDLLSDIKPSPQATCRALDRVRLVLSQTTVPAKSHSASPWRIFTRSRITGLAAAAAVIVGMLVLVSLFTGSLDGTTAAYARVTEAVRKVPWMRMRYSGYNLDDAGNTITAEGERDKEIWYSFNARVVIYKYARGAIDYYDYARHEIHEYNPVAKRIVASALPTGRRPFRTDSPGGWLEKSIEQITSDGGSVTRRRGQYKGQEAEVFEIASAVTPGVAAIRSTVFVDRTTSLPIAEERTYINTNTGRPQLVETAVFDYPEQGPADIYGLGLSRDIPTISSLPLPPWSDVRMTYESHRRKAPAHKYVAVVIETMAISGDPIVSVEICYADGARFRRERHVPYRMREEQETEIGNTLNSILKWSRVYKTRVHMTISLWIGNHVYFCQRGMDGSWGPVEERLWPREGAEDDSWGICPVARLAWPDIRGYADIIQDDYARENGLIRVAAERETFYLNPQRDYICQQRIPFGRDRSEVTEFAQTDTGRWYPKKIDGPLGYTIYLDTDPEFPEGIFDPNSLPTTHQP